MASSQHCSNEVLGLTASHSPTWAFLWEKNAIWADALSWLKIRLWICEYKSENNKKVIYLAIYWWPKEINPHNRMQKKRVTKSLFDLEMGDSIYSSCSAPHQNLVWSSLTVTSAWHLVEPVNLNMQHEMLAHFWRRSWLTCWLLAVVTSLAVLFQGISHCHNGGSGDVTGEDSIFTSGQLCPQPLSVVWWRDVLSWRTRASLHVTIDRTVFSLQHMTV